jgi:nitrate reductase gamma subunit
MAPLLAFIKGPMVWIALGVFLGGIVVHGLAFFAVTRNKDSRYLPSAPKKKAKKKEAEEEGRLRLERVMQQLQPWFQLADRQWFTVEHSVFRIHPVVSTVTVVFHLLLFIVPIFLLAHNELIRGAIGFSLPSLPESLADFLTVLVLLCGGFFLFRRLFIRRVRAISTLWDYFILLVTLTPFVSGFLAFHQWGDYSTVILVHIVSAELALILIPFTKLSHMVYFFLYRLLIGSEYSFGQGKRAW